MTHKRELISSRRAVLSIVALGAVPGCVGTIGGRGTQLRERWKESDEAPDRDEVNRQDTFDHATAFDEVSAVMPASTPLLGGQGARTNRHYEIEVAAENDVAVFVLDEYDPNVGLSLVEYLDGDFSYVPDYSNEVTRSHSTYVYVPDGESYTLVIDYPNVAPERRHLEEPIPIDMSVEGYYYLPFEVYEERHTDG